MIDIYNRLKYRVLSEGLDLNTIPRHKLLRLFKKRDDVIEEVVDSMILELLLGLEDIKYTYHSDDTTPHHFKLYLTEDDGHQYIYRLKYTKEELATLYPLDIFFAAWKKSDYKLMKGVKNSPLVRSVCAYLYDMRLAGLQASRGTEQVEEKIRSLM